MKTQTVVLEDNSGMQGKEASVFDEHEVLHKLKHYLPAQAPLKDFVHHNTLHAFQHQEFYHALNKASVLFGYSSLLSLDEYRDMFEKKRINGDVLEYVLRKRFRADDEYNLWHHRLLFKMYGGNDAPRIGRLRKLWRSVYHADLDALVHPTLFRIAGAFLDQGIAMWNFPVWKHGFLSSIKELEKHSLHSFFRTQRARELLMHTNLTIQHLLKILVGREDLFERYLFDMQFAHPGWSGLISVIEDHPESLLDRRKITLKDVIIFELLLEIDALDYLCATRWQPVGLHNDAPTRDLFDAVVPSEEREVLQLWQDIFEWSYYDEVLAGIVLQKFNDAPGGNNSFQGLFCIDDRECSIRRYLENVDPTCVTYGTPGFFNVEFFYKPERGKFLTKLCPAPVTPRYLIKEKGSRKKHRKEIHFSKQSHSLFRGWLISSTLGFWAALKLFANIFRPSGGPATAISLKHMDVFSSLTIVNKDGKMEDGLQVGFSIEEMADRVEGLLGSIGLINKFAPLVYVVGHGSSSVNNPHYAAYDCGACSGRPGSVNARVVSAMANNPDVRRLLSARGIVIPEETQFVGALHDTTRDDIIFYDEDSIAMHNRALHSSNKITFLKALDLNAKERSRRFETIDTRRSVEEIHDEVRKRSVSLFEPRPELNHATNALCIVGRRRLSKGLFLDRRSFLNSYDYTVDPDGKHLLAILKAAAPVCGGINLEYFFSRVDNLKLGAGTKLPHNVVGLFGVANGTDGDLRPGLPSQMIEVHDPVRLIIIVEHFPEVVLSVIHRDSNTHEWFANHWVRLVAVNPETRALYVFENDTFVPYSPVTPHLGSVKDITSLIESDTENFPVYMINDDHAS
jgi:uncharacterized protein